MSHDEAAIIAHIVFGAGVLFALEAGRAKLWAALFPKRSTPIELEPTRPTPHAVAYGARPVRPCPIYYGPHSRGGRL